MTEQVTVSKFVMMEEGFAVPSETGLAVSEQGCLAVAKRSEICVELYRNQVVHTGDTRFSANEIITEHLIRPYDVCFAPNNHLVITDNGDNSIKVYNVVGKPRLVRKFVCHQRNGNTVHVIEKMECNSELNIPDSSALPKILTPQSITAVPSPLCQLFVVFAPVNRIVVITMDWNTVEVIDFRQLSSPRDWPSVQLRELKECNKVSIVHDHTENHKVGGLNPLAITEAQFCAMFYHVSERKRDHINYKCLQRPMCRVGKMSRQTNPKVDYAASVVVYVRLTDCSNRLIFHARYGNCFDGKRRNTIHAEYLMLMDDEFRQAVQLLCHGRGGTIDMFMNKQPCYRSTKHHDKRPDLKKKECAQDLVDFFALHCSSHSIKFTINLCQLYKVDMTPSPSLQSDIQNGQEGVRKMISAGIELKAMTERSWEQLAGYASVELPEYKDSERQKLDQHIAEFLGGIKLGYKSKPRTPHRKTRADSRKGDRIV